VDQLVLAASPSKIHSAPVDTLGPSSSQYSFHPTFRAVSAGKGQRLTQDGCSAVQQIWNARGVAWGGAESRAMLSPALRPEPLFAAFPENRAADHGGPPRQLKVATRVNTRIVSAKSSPRPASHPRQRHQPAAAPRSLQLPQVPDLRDLPRGTVPDHSRARITAARMYCPNLRCLPPKAAAARPSPAEFPTCSLGGGSGYGTRPRGPTAGTG